MTGQIAPYVLISMEVVMLAGGVWLVAHALKTLANGESPEEKLRTRPAVETRAKEALAEPLSAEPLSDLERRAS